MPLTKKPSAQETYERRILVFRMKMRGLNHSVIAKELNTSRNTIIRDADWVKMHFTEVAAHADRNSEVGMAMAKFEQIEQEAMTNFNETTNPHAKNNFLLTALSASEKKVRLMMDAGLIQKAPVDVNLNIDYQKLTSEELLTKRTEVLSRLANLGAANGGKN